MFHIEQVDRPGQEEFIWAMRSRTTHDSNEEDDWRERRLSTASALYSMQNRRSEKSEELQTLLLENCTKIISSLLPDELISDPQNFNERIYEAAVVCGRINGLNALWDKYRVIGKGGPFRMSQTLNAYLGNVMLESFVYNGDVMGCSCDSFTIMWKQGANSMAECVHQAVDCGLSIAKNYSTYETDVGINISVSIGISCGPLIFCAIGTPKHASFVLTGDPLEDAKDILERPMEGNQVMVDQEAWEHLNSIEYIAKAYDNEYDLYVVTDFSSAWRSIQVNLDRQTESLNKTREPLTLSFTSMTQLALNREVHDIYKLRPSIGDAVNMNIYPALKRFVFPPIIAIIENDEPIETLTEMRHSVVLVANFAFEAQNYHDMIKLTDVYYKMVNNIIEVYNGYVNQITYTENELTFYILFGIHGDKNNFECRNALRAAMKCFKGSESSANLTWLSMCVVAGWIFCGPVGHHMRREYVVLGGNLSKASRLMAEFPNKITCDMETFLRSKLDARHFVLQERKQVVGHARPECVYQYLEQDLSNHLPKLVVNKYPLLDREYEVETFNRILRTIHRIHKNPEMQRYRTQFEPTGFFFLGEPRSGKTRLIDELIFSISTDFPMFRLRLNSLDKYVPYQTIYYLFGIPLGIAENSTISDREAKLSSKLASLPLDGLECMLNVIFRVNFPKLPIVDSLRKDELKAILKNLTRYLCRICFTRPWVIFIDCAEYIDNESWDLIYPILESHLVVLVVAIGSPRNELPQNAQQVLCQTKCKCVQLLPLDKLFHTTYACQIMNVKAIPLQLEKILHDKSNGSPGWIENFLLTLIHSNIIWIKKVNSMDFTTQTKELVLPAAEYMSRENLKQKLQQPITFKSTPSAIQPAIILYRKKWQIFEDVAMHTDVKRTTEEIAELINETNRTPPTSTTTLGSTGTTGTTGTLNSTIGPRRLRNSASKESIMHRRPTRQVFSKRSSDNDSRKQADNKKMFNICLFMPNGEELLNSYDVDSIQLFDIRKIMDSLTSFEMTVLKGASVIGDFFLRDMLMFIISCTEEIELAVACQHLFELGIIACGEGDFRRSLMNYAPIMSDRYKTYDDTIIACNCVGFLISEGCQEFPRYANCGFMRFINPHFRTAAYNLLTATQLNDVHTKALHFLEKCTRKCVSCGNGLFTKIMGNRYEEGVLTETKRKRRETSLRPGHEAKSSTSILEHWDYIGNANAVIARSNGLKRFERTRVTKADGVIFLAFSKSALAGEKAKTPAPFEDSDFTCCECHKILSCLYYHIRQHYEVTERYDKWLHATLEYAELCTREANVALAMKCLNHALEILKGPYKKIANPGEAWKYNVMKALVLAEMGRAHSKIGQTRLAYESYEKALRHYGYTLPKSSSLRYKLMESRQYILLATKCRRGIGTKFGYVAQFCDGVSKCLSMMTKLFIHLEMWDNAYIAAIWSLRKALQSEKNFIILINAFSNIIYVSTRKGKFGMVEPLEAMALDYCRRYKCTIDVNDMRSVTKLYAAIFYSRMQRGHFEDAFNIGVCVDPMTDMLHMRSLLIKLFPLFFEMLLMRAEVTEVLNALSVFEQVIGIHCDYNGDVWFHSLAVYFQLQTGCMLLDIKLCENYYYTQNKRLVNLKEPEAERRYFVSIWLWYLRTDNYDVANIWEQKLPENWTVHPNESISNLITTLLYLEGLIILVTYKMDRKMLLVIGEMHTKITALFRKMEEQAIRVKMIAPRLLHLKAYFYMCRMEDYKGWQTLDKATKIAQSQRNLFDAGWAKHSERAWKQDMPMTERTCWKDHSTIEMVNYREVESNNYKIMYFTLEMPIYF